MKNDIIKTRKKNSRHAIDLYRIVPRRERAADIERFVRCFGIEANDIKNPKQVCDNPSQNDVRQKTRCDNMCHTLLYTYSDLQAYPHSFLNAFKYWQHLLIDSRILADGSQFKQTFCKDCPSIVMDIV